MPLHRGDSLRPARRQEAEQLSELHRERFSHLEPQGEDFARHGGADSIRRGAVKRRAHTPLPS
jgi:hypothetical protein